MGYKNQSFVLAMRIAGTIEASPAPMANTGEGMQTARSQKKDSIGSEKRNTSSISFIAIRGGSKSWAPVIWAAIAALI